MLHKLYNQAKTSSIARFNNNNYIIFKNFTIMFTICRNSNYNLDHLKENYPRIS